jgi:protein-disulfide isomerase
MDTRLIIAGALAGALALGVAGATMDSTQQSKSIPVADNDRAAIEQVIRDYLETNPEVVVNALNAYAENRAMADARAALPALLSEETGFAAGKNVAAAKVAVIELFDYHCGFCKRATPIMRDLVNSDPAVKVVFRELPILREESETASQFALAAREQGRYLDFHFAVMAASGVHSRDQLRTIAKDIGMDVARLEKAAKSENIGTALAMNRQIARDLGLDGTPSFIVATLDGAFVKVIPGFRENDLKEAIAAAKKAS